jgi:hypothetical protein
MLGRSGNVHTKRRAGERLAVGAVADGERVGIDLRLEGDLAAMAVPEQTAAGSTRRKVRRMKR